MVLSDWLDFHHTVSVAIGNWWPILVSLGLGIWVGWATCSYQPDNAEEERS